MNTLTFSKGDVIFRQGSFELTMFDIQQGSVGIYSDYGTQAENQIAVLVKDQLLGEMGLIENLPRSATAVALEDDTVLIEFSEEELALYFRDQPEKIFRLMRQLSARIRETNTKYYNACHVLLQNEEHVRNGTEKDEALTKELESISRESEKFSGFSTSIRSSFFKYVLEDVEAYDGKREPVKASFLERLRVRFLSPDEMHVNPDDEFAKPSVGPNDRIINDYVKMIPMLRRMNEDIFPEPVIVQKIRPEGYMILNGHHRWAAALKTGTDKLHVKINNPK